MEEDNFDDISFLPPRHILIKAGGVLVALLALAGAMSALTEIPNNSRELTYAGSLQPTGRERPTSSTLRQGMQVDPSKAVGTSGRTDVSEPRDSDASPAVIHDLETILGNADASTLVGRHVDLHVPVVRENSLVTFWVGAPENPLLVVLHRDVRDGHERQVSLPPAHGIVTVEHDQQATISGTIQRAPSAEGRFSWDLTAPQRRALDARGVYLLADSVRTE